MVVQYEKENIDSDEEVVDSLAESKQPAQASLELTRELTDYDKLIDNNEG